MSALNKTKCKVRLANRVRYKISKRRNTRPRLSVFCSNSHVYAQIIDDINSTTLVSASTRSGELKELKSKSSVDSAVKVGELIAKKAKEAGIKEVVFDRGGKIFHGKVKALADAARTTLSF